MPLLDGKYEIIAQRQLSDEQTLFEATAPDGAAVRVVWYELVHAKEPQFEHYRRTLKRLKRSDLAAVYDVVSRPGAHYVAWHAPNGARPAEPDAELASALASAGYRAEEADIRRDGRQTRLYGLVFDGTPLPTAPGEPPPEGAAERPPPRTLEPPAWAVTLSATTALLLLAALLLAGGFELRRNDALVIVPDLLGSEVNRAAQQLADLGLAVSAAPVPSEREEGAVVNIDPAPGAQLRPGRTVRLSYALPAGRVTPTEVPRLVTLNYPEEAEAALLRAGLSLGRIARIPSDQAEGLVVSQRPAPGDVAAEGSAVDLLVSAGPPESLTFIPELVGLELEEARYLARLAGLPPERVIEEPVADADSEPGTVLAQSLRPNLPVSREDAVLRLVVAQPAAAARTAGLPSLVGLPLQEAREQAAGMQLRVEYVSDLGLPEGVVDQSPPAGSEADASSLTLLVNAHPRPVPRPAVRAEVLEPEPRDLVYLWYIEPGIPSQTARVYARTLDGPERLVDRREVRGGESLAGSWRTSRPGPVTFRLTLNGQPYGEELLVH